MGPRLGAKVTFGVASTAELDQTPYTMDLERCFNLDGSGIFALPNIHILHTNIVKGSTTARNLNLTSCAT
jgi:hypothetical protein